MRLISILWLCKASILVKMHYQLPDYYYFACNLYVLATLSRHYCVAPACIFCRLSNCVILQICNIL